MEKKNKQSSNNSKAQHKRHTLDARKSKNINEIHDVSALNWTSGEENDVDSHASSDVATSNMLDQTLK